MINKKTFLRIKLLHEEGLSSYKISQELKISKNTAKKYINQKLSYEEIFQPQDTIISKYVEIIDKMLKTKGITVKRIYEDIKQLGFKGKYRLVADHIRKLKKKKVVKPLKRLPKTDMSRHLHSYPQSQNGGKKEDVMAGKRAESLLKTYRDKYLQSSKFEKGSILDEFCRNTKYHRKYAVKLLLQIEAEKAAKRRRKKKYGEKAIDVIVRIWEAADYPWSERLHSLVPAWLPYAKTHMGWITPEIEEEVLSISPRQIDRRLKEHRKKLSRKIYGRTKPGKLLKQHIPIKTDNWDVAEPGFTEVDLVSHSGANASGEFIYSLNVTDIYSGWVETFPIMGKTKIASLMGIKAITQLLPFDLKGIDSDNGSEFINDLLCKYCEDEEIQFTRSRPYKKDDNAHVEQKNWTHIRKIVGYERHDSPFELEQMKELYVKKLRFMMNLFQPCVKIIRKERVGSKIKRKYDKATTPLDRLVTYYNNKNIPIPIQISKLVLLRKTVDPFTLSKEIEKRVSQIKDFKNQNKEKAM